MARCLERHQNTGLESAEMGTWEILQNTAIKSIRSIFLESFASHSHTTKHREPSLGARALMELVAGGVAVEFGEPPFAAIGWRGAVFTAFVAVPEAAVDEDSGFEFWQEDVHGDGLRTGSAECGMGNRDADVEAEAVAEAMEEAADDFFGSGVFAADAAHVPASAFRCEAVVQGSSQQKGHRRARRKQRIVEALN